MVNSAIIVVNSGKYIHESITSYFCTELLVAATFLHLGHLGSKGAIWATKNRWRHSELACPTGDRRHVLGVGHTGPLETFGESIVWINWSKQISSNKLHVWLVGGLEHGFYDFPFSWEESSSQLTSIFFRGVGIPPTRYDWPCGLNFIIWFTSSGHHIIEDSLIYTPLFWRKKSRDFYWYHVVSNIYTTCIQHGQW